MAVPAVRSCGPVSSSQLSKARVDKPRGPPRRLGRLREDSRGRTSEHSCRQPRERPSPLSPGRTTHGRHGALPTPAPRRRGGAAADVCNPQATWRGGVGTYEVLPHLGERCTVFTKSAEERQGVGELCPTTPLEETLRALDDLIRQGKIGYLGCSAYAAWQLAQANVLAELRGWTPFVVLQSEYHLFQRQVEQEVLPYCRAAGVGFVPYAPLAGGFLTGKYRVAYPLAADNVSGLLLTRLRGGQQPVIRT
jgi:Aldo/keto reductase family